MIQSIPLGAYVPGNSAIHRLPASAKLVGLIAFIIVVAIWAKTPTQAGIALAIVVIGYLIARIPLRTAAEQTLPVLPFLLIIGAFQVWQASWFEAVALVVGLFASVAAATLLTLTTTIAELMESLESALRPFERFGLPVETISLALSLTIRLIPLMLSTVNEVLEARKARGAGFSVAAFGTPVVIRSIRRARQLGEALMARGVGD
ncbi:energy-coupling factor transporter transmembrane protein EcfT [Corynebacterium breve]|uniref:Energy-coupling factor transporter transmembrane protein EcfT n=1 Tax=Corynebacterium breve TaxID=3049799 RepID=A0ABY8VCY4_9CORY|nr:energy-coupling factor transporter transmembrane protein EcfT [Corynebacterium breve]WIM66801.1 energy-coupling factor transporter transmembrane protein EcfT [Corynebacterium breve]